MKTKRIIAFLVLMLSAIPSFSQERGFFRIYERDDKSFGPSFAVELSDGSFIVAANDPSVYGQYNVLEVDGELLKLSAEGQLLQSVPVTDEDGYCKIMNIFRHPTEPGLFIGTGLLYVSNVGATPYLFQFDENLNITLQTCLQWPNQYQDHWVADSRTMLDRFGKLFSVFLRRFGSGSTATWDRLYAQISPAGVIEHIVSDTADLYPRGCATAAVFESPYSGRKGIFRESFVAYGSGSTKQKLYRLNKAMEAEEVNEIYRFAMDTVYSANPSSVEIHSIYLNDFVKTTVLPLNDSTLLYASIGDEFMYKWTADSNLFVMEKSAVMFKTDTEGNIQQEHFVAGSWNDTIEAIPGCSFGVTDEDASGNRYIYHCCETEKYTTSYDSPNTMTITKMTEDFDIVWQKRYALSGTYMQPRHLLATSDGGCFVVGLVNRSGQPFGGHHEVFALKINADGTVSTDEITVTDDIFFYPNPVKDVLHLHYPEGTQPQAIELYDLQGRLVRTQRNGLESLNMEGLATGQYVMKVTMEDGKVYTDKVVKE